MPEDRRRRRALVLSSVVAALAVVLLLIIVLVRIEGALSGLQEVQNFDHGQTTNQLAEAKEKAAEAKRGADIIPQAIHTLERHLDHTIAREAKSFRRALQHR